MCIYVLVQYFLKTGECKYGTKCRFNHPIDKLENKTTDEQSADAIVNVTMPIQPASAFNSRGLPLRPVSLVQPF